MSLRGGGSGIGFATAKIMGGQGYHIILVGRTARKLENAVAELRATGIEAEAFNIVFAVLLIGCMIGSFLQTALATALPVIMKDFQISASVGQWLTSAYSLAMGIMVPATAFLIRRFPARNLFLIFMAIFTAGSFVSATAFSFPVLMAGRILQALGCGVVLSLTQVVIFTIFPAEKRGAMMGIYGLAVSAVPVFSPALAGIVVDYVGWQSIFWVIAVLSALDFLVGVKAMSSPMGTVKQRFDLLSMALCTLGFCGVTLALGNFGTNGLISVYVLLPFLTEAVSLVLFTMRQLRMREPMAASGAYHPSPKSQIYGLDISFVGISVIAAVLFLTAVVFVRKDGKKAPEQEESN